MSGRSILVTGGAGYIGSHAVLALRDAGYSPVVLDNLDRGHAELVGDTPLVRGDVGDTELVESLLREREISGVLHFAALAYVGESVENPAAYYKNNVSETIGLLDAMRRADVRDIVFSSTCAVYGNPEQLPVTEGTPLGPVSPYGWSKRMIEQILTDYARAYGMRPLSLRYFNVAGADPRSRTGEWHEPETHLLPLALRAAINGSPISLFGTDYPTRDGTCVRDYVHVSDLADAHVLALKYLGDNGPRQHFNLGSENGVTVREMIDCVQRTTGKPLEVKEAGRREGDAASITASCAAAQDELGWAPRLNDIEEMVRTAWAWHTLRPETLK